MAHFAIVSFAVEDLIDYEEDYFPDTNCVGLTEERIVVHTSGNQSASPSGIIEVDNNTSGHISSSSIEIELGSPPQIGQKFWTKVAESREVKAKKHSKRTTKKSESSVIFCYLNVFLRTVH